MAFLKLTKIAEGFAVESQALMTNTETFATLDEAVNKIKELEIAEQPQA
jgi:hypothetical protein